MLPKPRQDLKPNTAEFERLPFVKATGFREYDARWRYPEEINLLGLQTVGMALAALMRERGVPPRLVVGHDYRSYSASIKAALIEGLLAGGAEVHDIGLALSPMAYFAQFDLKVEGVAMVTASHNDNGWTGIKMGIERPLTFSPEDMTALKERVLEGRFDVPGGGRYNFVPDMPERYMADLLKRAKFVRPLKAATAPPAPSRRACSKRSGRPSSPSIVSSTTPSRPTIRTPKISPCFMPRGMRCSPPAPMPASPSTATATAAAWSTMKARPSLPTRSACFSPATSPPLTVTPTSSPT
jgi:hypothetical protein